MQSRSEADAIESIVDEESARRQPGREELENTMVLQRSRVLTLMRHAKAINPELGGDDRARELNGKGEWQAILMGTMAGSQGFRFDYKIVSPASRTAKTHELFAKAWQEADTTGSSGIDSTSNVTEAPLILEEALYFGGLEAYFDAVQKIPEDFRLPLLIAHNPDLEHFAEHLTGKSLRFTPGTMVRILLEERPWIDVSAAGGVSGRVIGYFRPKVATEIMST